MHYTRKPNGLSLIHILPLTADNRLSAKEIIGNRKQLIQWQDDFYRHMTRQYPQLERGESAAETGRDHIPPRVFKQMARLNKQKERLEALLDGVNLLNYKARAQQIGEMCIRDSQVPCPVRYAVQYPQGIWRQHLYLGLCDGAEV